MLTLQRVPGRETAPVADMLGVEIYEDEELFIALDGETIVGYAIYALTDLQVVVSTFEADGNDAFVIDGLLRAVMNYAENRGREYVDFDEECDGAMLDRLGFYGEDGRRYNLLISKFLQSGCGGVSS